ncbi:glycoside hydrolase family 19 protein [Marinomonas posidonica]|uniref:Chitinase n=1 Tax=Marinomonas posidonica (strain CECT 7376 / NCIMB 14433 / IVIA-Po-181) TaxID=491952 RepID=F6CWU7_MARPP|nr:hypothetical protein [Marinomonas posidonica]AEF55509.1 hypothetical protein Mar181_2476 [Marinomonas posidonica IVIA-Po-181]
MTMKFVYPVPKPNGHVYEDGNELQTQLQKEVAGQYGFNPGNSSWHGGMHLSLKNAPHCQKDHPIMAIADGKVVAYRVNNVYSTSVYRGIELPYSRDFCLLQHKFSYTEDDQTKTFTFFSLYMHLAPLAEEQIFEQVNGFKLPNWLYTEITAEVTDEDGLSCRTDSMEKANYAVSKGQKFKYDPRQLKPKAFGMKVRHFARCTLEPPLNSGGSSIAETWLCVDEDLVKTIDATTVKQGALIELSGAEQIDIKGGDAIGYLGQFHIPTQIEADTPVVDPRYQIHFELFSTEEPPEAFLKRFFGEANLDKVKKVEGDDDSDGYLDRNKPNGFFKNFHQIVTLDESDVPGTEIAKNLSKWDSAQYMYHKHASEWYDKAADKTVWQTILGIVDSSNFEKLIDHEKERVDKLIWMQEASSLGLPKVVWNWWPIGTGMAFKPGCYITKEMLRLVWNEKDDDFVFLVDIEDLEAVADEINEISATLKLDTLLRLNHFLAQAKKEAGKGFSLEENLHYSAKKLKQKDKDKGRGPFKYFRDNPREADLYGRVDGEGGHSSNPEQIANRAYANRNGNGNIASGDGWRYRGRGIFQLTGKKNYRNASRVYNILWPEENIDFEANPDLLLQIKYAVRSAGIFWLDNAIWEKADKGSSGTIVDNVTKIINSGTSEKSKKERRDNFSSYYNDGIFNEAF